MSKKIKLLSTTILIVLSGAIIFSYFQLKVADQSESRKFVFEYNIILDKSSKFVEVWIPIPQKNKVQTIQNVNLNNGGLLCKEYEEAIHGNKYYYCSSDSLSNDVKLTLSCDVERLEQSSIEHVAINDDLYKASSLMVPVGLEKFNKVIDENNLESSNVENIYNYVLDGMHYGKPKSKDKDDIYYSGTNPKTGLEWLPSTIDYGEQKVKKDFVVVLQQVGGDYTYANGNSEYACDIGVGNCTDYHSYFISLCRTLELPARFHMGFSIPSRESEGEVKGYHCWADYYQDGQWHPVDISEADKDPLKAKYYFGALDYNRVEFTIGRDLKLINHLEPVNFFGYPIVKGTNYTKSFAYKSL